MSEHEHSDANTIGRLEGKKAVRKFARRLAEPDTIRDLNITPMMDMMTIILVFLLKSFSSSSLAIPFDENLKTPSSTSQLEPKQAVAITISKKVVLVEGDAIAPVNGGKIDPNLKRDGENGYYITPLVGILEKYARKEQKVAEHMGQEWDKQLMVVADVSTPYRLLVEILYSCGQAGYTNYRLLVLKKKE